jgi:GntR family transcriptional regulator, transcriptional repressor for pyruvate dehydrogenase complex
MTTQRAMSAEMFSPLKSTRKSDEVFEQIAEFIRGGRFAAGSKLPAERELAATFNTSRQTIREALYRAELVGLIEVRHGTGSFVKAGAARHDFDESLNQLITQEAHRISEFFDIRRALEGWCAAHAARMARESDIQTLAAKVQRMRELELTDDAWETTDIEFHLAVATATRNPLAIRMMEILRESFAAFYRLKRFIPNKEDKQLIWQHHFDVYDAIRRHAPEDARKAIIEHMDFVEAKLNESVQDIQSD